MPTARSRLEGVIVNDPSHPAIREFILKVERVLEEADKEPSVKKDVASLCIIHLEMTVLKQTLFAG